MIALSALEGFGIVATFIIAFVGLVIGIHNQRQQSRHDSAVADMQAAQLEISKSVAGMQAAQLEIDQRLADVSLRRSEAEAQAALRAVLRFRLVSSPGPGLFQLVVRNEGMHDAANVVVHGAHDTGSLKYLMGFGTVASDDTKAQSFTNSEWQVLGGERFDLRFTWTDGRGDQEDSTTAMVSA